MKKLTFLFVLVSWTLMLRAQKDNLVTFKPLPVIISEPVNTYQPVTQPNYNTYNYNYNVGKKSTSINFDNSELKFFKTNHIIQKANVIVRDTTYTNIKEYVIRTNYIIDKTDNNVWDIKDKKYNKEEDMMIFYCTKNDEYYSYFGIKMDGTTIIQFWGEEGGEEEFYINF